MADVLTIRPHECAARTLTDAPVSDWSQMGPREHFVQFYERDSFLVQAVSGFVASGLQAGDAVIVIATAAHREALEAELQRRNYDVAGLRANGDYLAADAAETLGKFMTADGPDAGLFHEVIGSTVAHACRGGRRVRAFGEMVALLWAQGQGQAAIRLEELWNELATVHAFSLFCAYPMDGFRQVSNSQPFAHICKTHTRVIPAESYTTHSDSDDRLRAITLLQQKASSLDAEIAEREHAECIAQAGETRIGMAAAIAGLGIWELDLLTSGFVCSDQCRTHLGLSPGEPLTRERFETLVHPEDQARVQTALQEAVLRDDDYNVEFRVMPPEGRMRWVAARGRCIQNGSRRMLGVTMDITERKLAAEKLEQAVCDRTTELRETVAELEAFSYSISHDMRAPLRAMRGFAEILAKECGDQLTSESRRHLNRIVLAGERMDRLIQDVLTFSRVARSELKLEPVNLDHLTRGILECYPYLQPPEADIVIDGILPTVRGNAAALTQCLSNLLGNAVKFVREGVQPNVQIWAERIDAPASNGSRRRAPTGPVIRLCVRDNGIGISKEAQEQIFTIFQRVDRTFEGTGIGLAIVKKAAERMGGHVGVSSEPGQGSTFWIELNPADAATP